MKPQRRGRRIAMTQAELDAFLREHHTCRVATISASGPHVAPMWFFWDGTSVWLNSVVASQRWRDLQRDPRVAIVVDAGDAYAELRGVEVKGRAVPVGEAPRTGSPTPSWPSRNSASTASTATPTTRSRTTTGTPGCGLLRRS